MLTLMPTIMMLLVADFALSQVNKTGIHIYSASTKLQNDVYLLDAALEYHLNADVIEALDSGVPLTFELTIDIKQRRKYLWNDTLASLSQRYQIAYQALTQQYVVTNVNSGVQNSYSSRNTALLSMGRITDFPLLDAGLLNKKESYYVSMRLALLISELPAPMRPWAYIDGDWRLKSDWYEWNLN